MGFFGSIIKFFTDIIKDALAKILTLIIILIFCYLLIRYVVGIDILKLFFG